MIDFN
jgi:hypothetical protein